ncbi:MAG: SUMF1/EgtB/PvdO family nonheme iron enzyme [Polyangiaceae bacterium]
MTKRARVTFGVVLVGAVLALAFWFRRQHDVPTDRGCGPGFIAVGPRCLVPEGSECPLPLVTTPHGCDAPDARVLVPASDFEWAPSDWEAPTKVKPVHVRTQLFEIDAFEVTVGRATCETCPLRALAPTPFDAPRALSNVTRTEAAFYCAARGGRLPTDAEWLAAARADVSRYPWGDTGAVCRRAAWGLAKGPCASGATGPDTVGTHPSGDTPAGIHDLGGNVSEWVIRPSEPLEGHARGGHYQAEFAAELRTWQDLALDPETRDSRVGFRCAYDVPAP